MNGDVQYQNIKAHLHSFSIQLFSIIFSSAGSFHNTVCSYPFPVSTGSTSSQDHRLKRYTTRQLLYSHDILKKVLNCVSFIL